MRLFGVPLFLLAAAPLLADGTPLPGRITDPQGTPLAGVEVWRLDVAGEPRRLAVTGADGRFALREGLSEACLELCHPAYSTASVWRGSSGGTPLDVVLAPAARVSGRVLDATGRPLSGAYVYASQLAEPADRCRDFDHPCPQPSQALTTGGDGRFVLDHLAPGLYELGAEAEGFLDPPSRHLELAAGELQVPDLLLEPGAVLRGRVVAVDGRPLAGMPLIARGGRSHEMEVESAADGGFTLAGLEPGDVDVHFDPPDREDEVQTVEVAPGENRLDLVYGATRRHELRGRVVDAGGRPVAGARVLRLGGARNTADVIYFYPYVRETLTGADGSFALPAGDGLHELQAEAPGYATAHLGQPIRVRGASVEGLELRLSPGVTLRARVTGASTVWYIGASQRHMTRQAALDATGNVVLDTQGWATIADVGPGRWHLRAGAPEFQAFAEVEIEPGATEAKVELEPPAAPSLVEGRVLGPDGAPVPEAVLECREERSSLVSRREASEDGSVSLQLPAGTYRLVASARGYASVAAAEPLVVADAPVRGIALRVGEPVPLAGRVVGLGAEGLLHAEVLARQGDIEHRVRVDPDGEFAFTALGRGDWEVSVRDFPRVARVRVRLDEHGAEGPIEIVFPDRFLTLAGSVTGVAMPAALEVQLTVAGERDVLVRLPLDDEGRFAFAGLAPESYELSVRDRLDDRLLHHHTFALTADRTIIVPLREGTK